MSTYTDSFAPVLVSEVPAVARVTVTGTPAATSSRSPLWARFVAELSSRRDARAFERAIGRAEHNEAHDLLAASRRS